MGRAVAVGRVLGAHGLRGEVIVQRYGEGEEVLARGSSLILRRGDRERAVTVREARPHKKNWIVTFEEIGDRDAAEAVRGASLEVDEGNLPPLEEGTYYAFQLVGLEVVTGEGVRVGRITGIAPTGAHDLFVIAGPGGEILVPSVGSFVKEVDLTRGRVVIEAPPGLLPAELGGGGAKEPADPAVGRSEGRRARSEAE